MIMHTIVQDETLYEGLERLQPLAEVEWNGALLQVERLEGGNARIVRLISPDPGLYLDPRFQPGQMIEWPQQGR